MNYKGIIIEESLDDKSVLDDVTILSKKISPVTEKNKTPWVTRWTLHTVEIAENKVEDVVKKIENGLDKDHEWYVDFRNDQHHYIIYRGKTFKVDVKNPVLYKDAREYGVSVGIPEYQVNFEEFNGEQTKKS